MTEIDTNFDVYVLGDQDTSQRMDLLAEKAAECGASIAQTFAFAPGEVARNDDLTEVDAVVEALGRAIATGTSIWIPFWLQDLAREEHLRRLDLTLRRHGLELLLGPQLVPVQGGINQIDAAVRSEVQAVFALDDAAMAAAAMRTLGPEIEAALARSAPLERVAEPPFDEDEPRERFFSTAEAAKLFGKSAGWVSRGLREGIFRFPDGSAVEAVQHGRGARRFTVPVLRAIAWSAYRRGTLSPQRLQGVLAELARSER